jgi:hypothetical protein
MGYRYGGRLAADACTPRNRLGIHHAQAQPRKAERWLEKPATTVNSQSAEALFLDASWLDGADATIHCTRPNGTGWRTLSRIDVESYPALLAPTRLAGKALRNRVIHASMTTELVKDGAVSP